MRLSPTRLFVAEAGCLYPFRADVKPKPEPENPKMRRGKAIHSDIERALITGEEPETPEGIAAVGWFGDYATRGQSIKVEFCMGVEPATGAVKSFPDKDKVPADWMPVIVDLMVVGHRVECWDWKTGSPFSSFDYRPQIRANAYAVATHLGRDEATAGLAYVSAGGVKSKEWELDAFDFADQRRKLRLWSQDAPDAKPQECDACRYCPARTVCPAQVK